MFTWFVSFSQPYPLDLKYNRVFGITGWKLFPRSNQRHKSTFARFRLLLHLFFNFQYPVHAWNTIICHLIYLLFLTFILNYLFLGISASKNVESLQKYHEIFSQYYLILNIIEWKDPFLFWDICIVWNKVTLSRN